MCGIIGYYGSKNPKNVILKGLKSLEYRGYDSAGVSIWHKNTFKRVRAKGNLQHLEKKIMNLNFDGSLGIGHIRWATHGKPNEINAHPHEVKGVSIVHNGIIENYSQLKEELTNRGVLLQSETDSELLAHLISEKLMQQNKKEKSLLKAVLSVMPSLQGSYSCLVVSEMKANEMVAFKKDLPLVLGCSDHSVMVASDVEALRPYVHNVLYLEDEEVTLIQGSIFKVFSKKGEEIKDIKKATVQIHEKKKDEELKHAHFMLKEILEQPKRINQLLQMNLHPSLKTLYLKDLKSGQSFFSHIDKIFIVACGSSFYAALYGKYLLEQNIRIPVEVDIASEFQYRNPILTKKTLTLFISQSGETADTLSAMRIVQSQGFKTLGICNTKHSLMSRKVDECFFIEAGLEKSVASTKTFMNTLVLLHLLSLKIKESQSNSIQKENQSSSIQDEEVKKMIASLFHLPTQMEKLMKNSMNFFSKNASKFAKKRGFLFMGRGFHYPIALEGALKIKELTYKHAEGFAAGELKHGPLALVDASILVIVLAPSDSYYKKTFNNLIEVKSRGGEILTLGTEGNTELKKWSDFFLALPKREFLMSPLLEVIPLQLLAYYVAISLGHDVDRPRNLAKSVTVE